MTKISADYYLKEDVVSLSKDLLGKLICTKINGKLCKAVITETEAYAGIHDKASHAYGGRRSNRTEIMYAQGGVAYVYLCYGMHFLFNIVTNIKDVPHAILIRGIHPYKGIDELKRRRASVSSTSHLFDGPGKVTQALGINKSHNGISLQSNTIWLEDLGIEYSSDKILLRKRIGIDYAKEDASLLYRFLLKKESKMFAD